jgi:hypothetical protein
MTFYRYPSCCAFYDPVGRCWRDRDDKLICTEIDLVFNNITLFELGYIETTSCLWSPNIAKI